MNHSNPKRNMVTNIRRSKANFWLTKKGDRESLQNTSPSPQEEIPVIVGQKTDGSSGQRHEKVRQRQIDDDVIERLSELLEPEGDQHHREVLAQRHRGHYEHQCSQDSVVPGRDGGQRSHERILPERLHLSNRVKSTKPSLHLEKVRVHRQSRVFLWLFLCQHQHPADFVDFLLLDGVYIGYHHRSGQPRNCAFIIIIIICVQCAPASRNHFIHSALRGSVSCVILMHSRRKLPSLSAQTVALHQKRAIVHLVDCLSLRNEWSVWRGSMLETLESRFDASHCPAAPG